MGEREAVKEMQAFLGGGSPGKPLAEDGSRIRPSVRPSVRWRGEGGSSPAPPAVCWEGPQKSALLPKAGLLLEVTILPGHWVLTRGSSLHFD